MDLQKLNDFALERISDYQNLKISNTKVVTPYYINNIGNQMKRLLEIAEVPEENAKKFSQLYKEKAIPFGWYRGKGSPEEFTEAVLEISQQVGINLGNAKTEGIVEFMKLYGLGIDCSGFVYQVLWYAFEKYGKLKEFTESLAWADKEKQTPDTHWCNTFKIHGY